MKFFSRRTAVILHSSNYSQSLIILGFLIALVTIFSVTCGSFLRFNNLVQISAQMVELSLITLGMSICIISGGFDLSIGALTGLGSVCLAMLIRSGLDMWLSIFLVGLLLTGCGAINGALIGFLKLDPLLVTLGTSSVFTGLAMALSKGRAISRLPDSFFIFGQGHLGFIPCQVIILVMVSVFTLILLNSTGFGRKVYLIGSNPKVARFAGINCGFNLMLVYTYSALLAFFAALVLTSRLATGRADLGSVYVLASVSAAVFGGIKVTGGSGNLLGAILGVIIFSVITNGFNLLDFSQFAQQIVVGVMLIAAYALWERNK